MQHTLRNKIDFFRPGNFCKPCTLFKFVNTITKGQESSVKYSLTFSGTVFENTAPILIITGILLYCWCKNTYSVV